MKTRGASMVLLLAIFIAGSSQHTNGASNSFVNFETPPVHPVALSPDNSRLAVCNLANGRLELFDVSSGTAVAMGSVPVGVDPVSVRFLASGEAWVVNHISDSISIVDVESRRVVATLQTLDTPADVIFAGSPRRAFVSCAMPNTVQVFNPFTRQLVTNLVIDAERPKALASSPDGRKVYAAIFESGNATTIVGANLTGLTYFSNVVSLPTGPYRGQNPPPNKGTNFSPAINPALSNAPAPKTGLIIRKNSEGRWKDDNQGDWTQFVSGTNAPLTRRVPGWDLPDRDVAVIDTEDFSITYATGLMNLCMGIAVNPASGQITVVGTDAINEMRFMPNLNGIFVRAKLGLVDPLTLDRAVMDLNPHLDYVTRTLPPSERDKSLGEPRGIVWNAAGTRAYVAGMGSRNLVVLDSTGQRARPQPIELEEGPIGMALDDAHGRLYVLNRFSMSLSIVDTESDSVLTNLPLFDLTPRTIKAGRRHLYDTRRASGLGQASCASCHPDARMDRLAWDLGDPTGKLLKSSFNLIGEVRETTYHPMKGVMVTQTLQDILGHEPFHWRGDMPFFETFNQNFTNLLARPTGLTTNEIREFKDFLATIRFPPNPYRTFENGLSTNVPLPGHRSQGGGGSPAGTPLPNGDAMAGFQRYRDIAICAVCHSLPTGLGSVLTNTFNGPRAPFIGTNGETHVSLYFRLEGSLPSKIAQFRNMPEKVGMDGTLTLSRAGFGFGHDGSVDSLERFIFNVGIGDVRTDRDVANMVAFTLSLSGSDLPPGGTTNAPRLLPGLASQDVPTAFGKQITLGSPYRVPLLDAMLALAHSPTSRVDLIAKGSKDGAARGWFYERTTGSFQSDRRNEALSPDALIELAGAGRELTFTLVSRGTGQRLGIDSDGDSIYDGDEADAGTNPEEMGLIYFVRPPQPTEVIVTSNTSLRVTVDSTHWDFYYQWLKDGVALEGATNDVLVLTNVPFAATGDYSVLVGNRLRAVASPPARLTVTPSLANIAPSNLVVRVTSNATFTVSAIGEGPFNYQWLHNGVDVPYASSSTLTVTNVQVPDEGPYSVRVANAIGTYTTKPVSLVVLSTPVFVVQPLGQEVLAGDSVTFSAVIAGNPPPFGFQLRRGSQILTNHLTDERFVYLTFSNVQRSNVAPYYRVVVINAANVPLGTTSEPFMITVLDDNDGDGLPDRWEAAHGMNTNDPVDAQLDSDLDRQTNWQEYIAGTDPFDAESNLRLESEIARTQSGRELLLRFAAVSNRTYSVQFRDRFDSGPWTRWLDLAAYPTNRFVTLTNPLPVETGSRAYRIVTPRSE